MKDPADKGFRRPLLIAAAIVIVVAAGLYYARSPLNGHASDTGTAPPPPATRAEVTVLQIQSVRLWTRFSGRLTAVDSAEIKPQVSGEIQQVLFEDGEQVTANQLLFCHRPPPL